MWQVIGQARALALLQHGLENGSLAHAYLFVGPEHIGKMTAALNLARALNCEASVRPCLKCNSCAKIASGNHSDVQVIRIELKDEEGEERKVITIKQIQDLLRSASLPPFEGKHKVFILDYAELLSNDAANCFLKTLEEPEKNVTFILITTNEKLLLSTVISRCQRIEFQPVPANEEAAALTEKLHIEPERARLLAALSRGCPGWAIMAAGDASMLEKRDENLNRIVSIIKADAGERFAYVAGLAAGFTKDRKAVYDVLDMWRDLWRDMMLVRLGCTPLITNVDRKDEIMKIAGSYSLAKIKNFIKSLESAGLQLKQNVNPRLALEVLMLDIPIEESNKYQVTSNKE